MGKGKKKTLDPEKTEVEAEAEAEKKPRRRKQTVVVSRFFPQDAAAIPQNQGSTVSGGRKRRRGKRSQDKAEVVVSRFFPQDPTAIPPSQGCSSGTRKGRRGKRSREEKPEIVVSRFFLQDQGPITGPSTKRSREEKPEIVVSRFFQDREPGKGGNRASVVVAGGKIAKIEEPKASAKGKRKRKRVEESNLKKKERVVREPEVSLKLSRRPEEGRHSDPVIDNAEIYEPKASAMETRVEESNVNKERVVRDHASVVVAGGKIAKIGEPKASAKGKRFGESKMKKERVVREPEVSLKNLSRRPEEGRHSDPVIDNAEIYEPKASAMETRMEESDVNKERVVSRFFQNPPPGPDSTEITNIDELFSRFAYKGACDVPRSISNKRIHSANYQKRSLKSDSGPSTPARVERVVSKAPVAKPPKKKKKDTRSTLLRAAEKKKEAYRRKDADNPWKPPRTVHRLLQEDHAHDPWRVLVICMLLNLTTGKQTGQILETLFSEFPDAKAAANAPEERLQEIIKTLGLHKKRSRMIKRMSQEYLDEGWTHVTQLHGVGKYAADAYAIFCTGKWYDVNPVDHKLKDYWDYLCANEDQFR